MGRLHKGEVTEELLRKHTKQVNHWETDFCTPPVLGGAALLDN